MSIKIHKRMKTISEYLDKDESPSLRKQGSTKKQKSLKPVMSIKIHKRMKNKDERPLPRSKSLVEEEEEEETYLEVIFES